MKKKCSVVMLPTNEKAPIAQYRHGNKYLSLTTNTRNLEIFDDEEYRHLHITSDEEIKEGDWCIQNGNYLCKITCNQDRTQQGLKKIIATTDKSLTISEIIYPEEFVHVMPSPSDGFIKKFIERYNAGNPITEIMVEYEEYPITTYGMSDGEPETDTRLKVDKNNCITIRPVKESWTREELPIEVMKDMLRYCEVNQIYDKLSNFGDFYYKGKKWIEQNL